MAITLVGSNSASVVAASATDVNLPAGLQENDIVVVALACDNALTGSEGIATAGYTKNVTSTNGAPGHQIGWKRMGASPDSVVSIQGEGSARTAVAIQAWRGVDATTAIDVAAVSASGTSASMPNPASNTTVTDGALRIVTGHIDDDETAATSAPTGYSNLINQFADGAAAASATVMMASKISATAGAEDPDAFGGTNTDNWFAYHFALRPSAASGLSLAVDAGSFTLTGTAASLERGRKVVADSGSFALTGTPATLRKNLPLSAAGGSFALTGSTAALEYGREVEAASGAYTITGSDAALTVQGVGGIALSVEAGSFVLTGTAAAFLQTRELVAASGAYALTGSAADLIHLIEATIIADSGSYTLTGTPANLQLVADNDNCDYTIILRRRRR